MADQRRLAVLGLVGAGLLMLGSVSVWEPAPPAPAPVDAPVLGAFYAPPVEELETHVMRRGETLSGMLARSNIPGGELAELLLALREFMNPRRLVPGVEVTFRRRPTSGDVRGMDVQLNADTLVHLARDPASGWRGELRVTPTVRDTLYVQGEIKAGRTLFEALAYDDELQVPASERYALVAELARIYSYQIDFAHEIQPGDSYRFVLERDARPDGSTRWRRVLAAVVTNRGEEMPAVHFALDERDSGYYDLEGRSLVLAFSRYPLDYVRITSTFAWRRYHPVLGRNRPHLGTDFGASTGTRVRATGAGTVSFAGRNGGYGNLIKIRHHDGYETRYAHLRGFASGVRAGTRVQQGQIIGYVGATGLATAPHLHYEFRRYDRPQDARTVRLPGAPPIPRSMRAEYNRVAAERMALLERSSSTTSNALLAVRRVDAGVSAGAP
ncbi:MAG TPA: M23 family metallopeptidase [Longimicrobiales bacterium]|nr:M23 family metallopeptidase [Longimicrobiales bacterium]